MANPLSLNEMKHNINIILTQTKQVVHADEDKFSCLVMNGI